jgi:hypothetical protein
MSYPSRVKPHENGYKSAMQHHPLVDGPPTASQGLRTVAAVVGVVLLVLALLIVGVYAVVYVDLMPQMR